MRNRPLSAIDKLNGTVQNSSRETPTSNFTARPQAFTFGNALLDGGNMPVQDLFFKIYKDHKRSFGTQMQEGCVNSRPRPLVYYIALYTTNF